MLIRPAKQALTWLTHPSSSPWAWAMLSSMSELQGAGRPAKAFSAIVPQLWGCHQPFHNAAKNSLSWLQKHSVQILPGPSRQGPNSTGHQQACPRAPHLTSHVLQGPFCSQAPPSLLAGRLVIKLHSPVR